MTTVTPTGGEATREAMRAALIAQGYDPAAIDAAFAPPPTAEQIYRVQQAVADAIKAMRKHKPRSEKTWAPYLQLLVDGLPDMCPCPCPPAPPAPARARAEPRATTTAAPRPTASPTTTAPSASAAFRSCPPTR